MFEVDFERKLRSCGHHEQMCIALSLRGFTHDARRCVICAKIRPDIVLQEAQMLDYFMSTSETGTVTILLPSFKETFTVWVNAFPSMILPSHP